MDIELTIGKNITDGFVYFLQCTERAHFKCEVLLQHGIIRSSLATQWRGTDH